MPGTSTRSSGESILWADNVSFDGTERGGVISTDGELLIGSTVAPHIKHAVPTATAGTGISVTAGSGSLTFAGIDATELVKGVSALATDAEATAGAVSTKTIVPTSLKAKLGAQTLHGIPRGAGNTAAINWTAEPANGQLLIGKTGDYPQLATLTPGPGIAVTSGAGAITVSAWGGGLSWTTKGASTALVVNNGFIANAGAALSFSLPASSAVGDVVALILDGATSWAITQGAGQRIRIGSIETTAGAGGSITSTAQGDTIYLVCVTANTRWVTSSMVGNLTVV